MGSYNLARRNCHHFTDTFCQVLGFPQGPRFGIFGAGDVTLAETSWLSSVGGPLCGCLSVCTSSKRPADEPCNSSGPFCCSACMPMEEPLELDRLGVLQERVQYDDVRDNVLNEF